MENFGRNKKPVRMRILSVGKAGTGKTCLLKRYCEKRFSNKYIPTIGVDYGSLTVDVEGRRLSVHFFDTSGKAIFKQVRTEFYNDTQAVILTYDVNDKASFLALDSWVEEMTEYLGSPSQWNLVVLVCGTKSDACTPASRPVSEAAGRSWAQKKNFLHVVTSSALGLGVSHAFYTVFIHTLQKLEGVCLSESPNASDDPEAGKAVFRLLNCKNDFERLALPRSQLSKDAVNKAYRKLASLVHPDKCKISGAEEAFKVLNQSKNNLLKMVGE